MVSFERMPARAARNGKSIKMEKGKESEGKWKESRRRKEGI